MKRETFAVAGGEQLMIPNSDSETMSHEIRIGPEGSVYVWTPQRLGRIELP